MTKLQLEILESFEDLAGSPEDMSLAASLIAKKYLEMALDENGYYKASIGDAGFDDYKKEWLKEKGITD